MQLLEFQLVFEFENIMIDLHNDYKCERVMYDSAEQCLKCIFTGERNIILEFKGADLAKIDFFPEKREDSGTLNNFYRGRFEKDGTLLEYSKEGKGYYYLEFEKEDSLELYASVVTLLVS